MTSDHRRFLAPLALLPLVAVGLFALRHPGAAQYSGVRNLSHVVGAVQPATEVPVSGRNLLTGQHGGFDGGTGGWVVRNGRLGAVASPVVSGSGSLEVLATGPDVAAGSGGGPGTWSPAIPGARYSASVLVRPPAGRVVVTMLQFLSRAGRTLDLVWGQPIAGPRDTWLHAPHVVALAPAGATYVVLWVVVPRSTRGARWFLDDATLYVSPTGAPAVAGPLTTVGNRIVDRYGHTVVLRGMILLGYQQWPTPPQLTPYDIVEMHLWGANAVRIPLGEQLWLPNSCYYQPDYPTIIDRVVSWVTAEGMVALLDLHWNAPTSCGKQGQQLMADYPGSVQFWHSVAARYRGNPLVAFDLYNEPHGVSNAVWLNGGTVRDPVTRVRFRAAGMQQLYGAVRSSGARNLVFVSGSVWSAFWTGRPLAGYGIVYAPHVYTCPKAAPPRCTASQPYDPTPVLRRWVVIAQLAPVVITEFGWPSHRDGRYMTNVVAAAERLGWGWLAYAWDGQRYGLFSLTQTVGQGHTYEPWPAAMPVLDGLARNW